jgi:hydroxymethylpyrimidine/phosphomethylpyrimidine kinase
VSAYREGPRQRQILICSGLDPSGGAGLIADVRVAHTLGVRPVGAVTTSTIQSTDGMRGSQAMDRDTFGGQLAALLSDVEVNAVKIGMLGSAEIARELGDALHLSAAPVVWDPVFAPSVGNVQFDRGIFMEARKELSAHLTLVTPNLPELAMLLGTQLQPNEVLVAAKELARGWDAAVLVKGGHAEGDEAVDLLIQANGSVDELRGRRVPDGEKVHGTGCALSTAIACHLALGADLVEACRAAKTFVAGLISSPQRPGRGAPSVL